MVSKIKKIKTMEQLGNTHNTLTCDGSCKQKTRFVGYKMGAIGSSFLVFFRSSSLNYPLFVFVLTRLDSITNVPLISTHRGWW